MAIGIKESKEVLDALEAIGVKSAVLKDGFQLGDISVLTGIVAPLIEGIKGIELVDDEIKDLTSEELQELGSKALDIIKKIKDAWSA